MASEEQSKTYVEVPSLPYSGEVMIAATRRLIDKGWSAALGTERFDRLISRLQESYTVDTPKKNYFGSILLKDRAGDFMVSARSPIAARFAVAKWFGQDQFIKIEHESFRSMFRGEASEHVAVAAIPFSQELLHLLHHQECETHRRMLRLLGRELDQAKADQLLVELGHSYAEGMPIKEYKGWILLDDKKISLTTMARNPTEASAAVEAEFGENYVKSIWNEEDANTKR